MKSIVIRIINNFQGSHLAKLLQILINKIVKNELVLIYLRLIHQRIAGTIRDFRIAKFAQKDGLLAAIFELFLCLKVTKQQLKSMIYPLKSSLNH